VATFCLLHGAWHEPSCWRGVESRLAALGHRTVAPELPLDDPAATYRDRARPALRALEDASEPVVVVGHSQTSSVAALVADGRPVDLLIYLCPRMGTFGQPEGMPAPMQPGLEFPPDRSDGTKAWDPETAAATIYRRLPPDAARSLAERLRPMAMPPDDFPLTAHPDVPVELLYATHDEFFTPDFERFMARELLDVEPIELDSGHFPMAEDPEGLAELLDRLSR
jgi:pimeloyl-ACP methyl ester carboxylesterase